MRNCLVYISGPISPANGMEVTDNVEKAVRLFYYLTLKGIPSFCPHFTALHKDAFEISHEVWMAYDLAVLARCTHILMVQGWQHSKGAVQELQFAMDTKIPVYYELEDLIKALDGNR